MEANASRMPPPQKLHTPFPSRLLARRKPHSNSAHISPSSYRNYIRQARQPLAPLPPNHSLPHFSLLRYYQPQSTHKLTRYPSLLILQQTTVTASESTFIQTRKKPSYSNNLQQPPSHNSYVVSPSTKDGSSAMYFPNLRQP